MKPTQRKLSSKLRVLISGALPPPIGGVGAYYQTLLKSSLHDQIDLKFVQTSSQNRKNSSTGKASLPNLIGAIKDCWRFTDAILLYRPKIAHIGTAFGFSFIKHTFCVIIGRLFGARVLLHPHCSLQAIYNERSKIWKWYFRQVIRLTDGIVVLSKEWLQLGSIIPAIQIYYLPNAIDLTQYLPIAEKKLIREENEKTLQILYLGFLGREKGTFDLLNAAKNGDLQNRNLIFNLVGDELSPGELTLLIDEIKKSNLGGQVKIRPPVCGEDKLAVFSQADIFIYPSYYEGMPMAVIEAMACGLPIIATRVGGLPDLVVEGVNGILVEPGRPDRLATALCQLIDNRERCALMGKESNRIARDKFDIEQHVTQLIDIYRRVSLQAANKSSLNIPNI